MYEGSSYLLRVPSKDLIFELPNNIELSGVEELNFTKKTGIPSISGTVVLTHMLSLEVVNITINHQGFIF